MKPIDYIIIGIVALIVAAVAAYVIRKKLKGEKIGCGCGCQTCPHAGACGGAKPTCEKEDGACTDTKEKGKNENDETV